MLYRLASYLAESESHPNSLLCSRYVHDHTLLMLEGYSSDHKVCLLTDLMLSGLFMQVHTCTHSPAVCTNDFL